MSINLGSISTVWSVSNGGTGQSSYTDGQLLIGNSSGNTLTKSTLTAGSGVSITNAPGSITIASNATGAPTYSLYDDFRHGFYSSTGFLISNNSYRQAVANSTSTNWSDSSGLNLGISWTSTSTNSMQLYRMDTLATSGSVDMQFVATGINSGANAQVFFYGLSETTNFSSIQDNMIGFYYSNGLSNWQFITRKNGTQTITDTGISMNNTTFRTLKFTINSDFTQVLAYIDGSLVATHTTNIPTVALRLYIHALKAVSASYSFNIKNLKLVQN